MKVKAKHCEECRYWHDDLTSELTGTQLIYVFKTEGFHSFICMKGHKPRFYMPCRYNDDVGWKRRCDDFEKGGE